MPHAPANQAFRDDTACRTPLRVGTLLVLLKRYPWNPSIGADEYQRAVFEMTSPDADRRTDNAGDRYQALLAVSEAIISHRELTALFQGLALSARTGGPGSMHSCLVLHDAATNTMCLRVLETTQPDAPQGEFALSVEDDPAGVVWQTQQPFITSTVADLKRWPRLLEWIEPTGIQSICWLPLTTVRQRLGTLVFASKQPSAYDAADLDFLQLVANQVAVAIDNALAFQEIQSLKDQLSQEKAYLEEEVRSDHNFGEIVGGSDPLRRVLKEVETVAPTDSTVLVCGETGTGKELIARALHDLSPRRERTFVKLNCAAIPTGLLESELFGHEKGAFTGGPSVKRLDASSWHTGGRCSSMKWETSLQNYNLSCCECYRSKSLSGLAARRRSEVNMRLVAATNRDLAQMVADGDFRTDLYYRLNIFPVELPALRERPDDIPQLVRHFTQRFARRMGRRSRASRQRQ